ncbi:hypothetical protein BJ508DRAFT_417574 [Ascobolus immersus RN42]|uniref:Uncharacterized protein n=1 Tax=Ascobolus immersus RN42 TaxID=1160509 RepID=A0A3N4HRF9_ASCIM|nr:hypothetical protein BJ508DRAFT_417574 [Ascobolus immersus RN42]
MDKFSRNADATYYSKLSILRHLHGQSPDLSPYNPDPSLIIPDIGNIQKPRLGESQLGLVEATLPVADAFALFSVREAGGEIAAAHIKKVSTEEYEIRLASSRADQSLSDRMSGFLCQLEGEIRKSADVLKKADPLQRRTPQGLPDGLFRTVCDMCTPKMLSHSRSVEWSLLPKIAKCFDSDPRPEMSTMLENAEKPTFTAFYSCLGEKPSRADGDLVHSARERRMPLARLMSVLCAWYGNSPPDVEDLILHSEDQTKLTELREVSAFISILTASRYVRQKCKDSKEFAAFVESAKDFSAYFDGLRACWDTLLRPVKKGLKPIKLRLTVLPDAARQISLEPSIEAVVNDFLRDTCFTCSKRQVPIATINEVFGTFRLPETTTILYHPELQLAELLMEEGDFTFGVIGVSEGCCYTCNYALAEMRSIPGHWCSYYTSGCHGSLDLSLLPKNEELVKSIKLRVDELFMDEVEKLQDRARYNERPELLPQWRTSDEESWGDPLHVVIDIHSESFKEHIKNVKLDFLY